MRAPGVVLLLGVVFVPVGASRCGHDATVRQMVHELDGHVAGLRVTQRFAAVHAPYSSNRCQLFAGALVPAGASPPPEVSTAHRRAGSITVRYGPGMEDTHDEACLTCAQPGVRDALLRAGPDEALWFLFDDTTAGSDWRCM